MPSSSGTTPRGSRTRAFRLWRLADPLWRRALAAGGRGAVGVQEVLAAVEEEKVREVAMEVGALPFVAM